MRKTALALMLWSGLAAAQIGNFPALVGQRGLTPPTACTLGQLFFDTDATAGSNIYGCTTGGSSGTWTLQGGGSAAQGFLIGSTVTTSCSTANAVLYNASTPCSANLTFNTTNSALTIGSGSAGSAGLILQHSTAYSGYGMIYSTGVTPASSNYAFGAEATNTLINAPSGGILTFSINEVAKMTHTATAGRGLYLTPGIAAAGSIAALSVVRTNNDTSVDQGVRFVYTDTSSAAGFLPFQILGTSTGAVNLFSVDKSGNLTSNGLKTTGAATGKTVVCVDVTTGILYASTSGVACAN